MGVKVRNQRQGFSLLTARPHRPLRRSCRLALQRQVPSVIVRDRGLGKPAATAGSQLQDEATHPWHVIPVPVSREPEIKDGSVAASCLGQQLHVKHQLGSLGHVGGPARIIHRHCQPQTQGQPHERNLGVAEALAPVSPLSPRKERATELPSVGWLLSENVPSTWCW